MQEKLRIKKRKKLQKKLTRDASSQNPKSKHTLEFDEVSVKINPPLLQEFIDLDQVHEKEKRQQILQDLVNDIRVKKNRNFVTYINDYGSAKFSA